MEVVADFCEGQKPCAQCSEASKSSSRRPSQFAAESVPHPLACRSVTRRNLGIGRLFAANGGRGNDEALSRISES